MENKKNKRVVVIANGNQAPYGIGEIINDFPNTPAGQKKAEKLADKYYNRPEILVR